MIERCGCLRYRSFPTISQVGQIYPLFYRGKRRKCEELTKSAADVKNEFLASKTAGESLEDVEIPDNFEV